MHHLAFNLLTQRQFSPTKATVICSLHTMKHKTHLKNFKALAFHLCAYMQSAPVLPIVP